MEGLEISILNYRETFIDNSVKRFDAEYFKKKYLIEDNLRAKIKNKYLGDISFITDGQHGYHEVDQNSPIRHLKAQNFKNWFAVDNNAERIAKWVDDNNKRSSLEIDDIVLTTRGTVGFCAIVKDDVLPANIDQDVARIKLNNKNEIIPQFLLTYFNSRFGQDWTNRNQTGMVQQGLSLWRIREFPIPILSKGFQEKVKGIIEFSKGQINASQNKYSQAENLLLSTLGIQDFTPSQEKVNVKSYKESFLATGRLDAEYYQKKYEDILDTIRKQRHNQLGNLVNIDKSIEPGSEAYQEEGIPFVRVSNLSKMGLSNPEIHLDASEFKNVLMPKKDTILLSKDGTVGVAYKVNENMYSITSSAILHLTIKSYDVLPDYLTLVLNSKVVQMQSERDAGGSILQHWKPSEISQVEIPIIDISAQEKIASLVQESFSLKKQSEDLLELAKRAVEVAIEEGEEAGLRLINEFEIN